MKQILTLILFISYQLSIAQTTEENIGYVSPAKDTLMLPNGEIGLIIKDVWTKPTIYKQPVIIIVDEKTIKLMNKRYELQTYITNNSRN